MNRFLSKLTMMRVCKKIIRVSLVIALIVGNRAATYSQNNYLTPVIPPAPTSAVFLRYGNDQPSLQTGTVNIPIPLLNIQAKGLNIPLTLTYQTSGINVSDMPYPAGYGWVFSPGFRITRMILGRLDEGFPYRETNGGEDYHVVKGAIISEQVANIHQLNQNDIFDTQKDIFTLHMPSGSYNFFIKKVGTTYETVSIGHGLKIEPLGVMEGFKVTDTEGIIYRFGFDNTTSFQDYTEPAPFAGCTAWMLREIELPNSEKINFSWQKVNTNAYTPKVNTSIVVKDFPDETCGMSIPSIQVEDYGGIIDHSNYSSANALMLKKIEYPSGIIDLTYKSPQDPFLQEIKVRNKKYEVVKTIALTYGAVTDGNHLLLQSLNIQGEVYSFQYNPNRFYPLTTALDYWGYYNGKNTNPTLIPKMKLNVWLGTWAHAFSGVPEEQEVGTADRSVSAEHMKAFMLTKINYPTGGFSEYEYEPHQFAPQGVQSIGLFAITPSPISSGGGLRVSKISNYASTGSTPTIKTYKYGQNEDGLAIDPLVPTLETFIDEFGHVQEITADCGVPLDVRVYRQMNINSLSNYSKFLISKYPIWYDKVTEYVNNENKTAYEFSSNNSYSISWQLNYFAVKSPFAFSYDNLFNKGPKPEVTTSYKKLGSNYVPLQEVVNDYETEQNIGEHIQNVIIDRRGIMSYLNLPGPDMYSTDVAPNGLRSKAVLPIDYLRLYYSIPVKYDRLKKTTTTSFENGQALSTYKELFYSRPDQVGKVVQGTSIGNKNAVTYKYPYDFNDAISQEMTARNMVSPVIEEKRYKVDGSVETLLATTQTTYKQVGDLIVPDNIKASTGSLTPDVRAQFNHYDASGNILEQQKAGDVRQSYLWGYDKQYLIAQAVNAKANEIFFDSYEEGGTWDGVVRDNTRAHAGRYSARIDNATSGEVTFHSQKWLDIALTQTTRFKYSGWVYSTGPGAEIYFFMKTAGETGYFTHVTAVPTNETNKWVYLEGYYDVPANITKLNIRLDNNGTGSIWFDDIRLHPASAQMTTMTYDPLIGMTSQSDVNNRIQYYEYDGFNRLSLIRDDKGNILKKYCYNYYNQVQDCGIPDVTPLWQVTNITRCQPCPANSNYTTGLQEHQEQDNNPNSLSHGDTRWVSDGASSSCAPAPNWQNTATAVRCKVVNGQNTSELEQEQADMNPCSGQGTRWVVISTNCTTCPKPQAWVGTNNYRCITANGINTGGQEREEVNTEACSPGANTTRWVSVGTNCVSCPKPQVWQATGNYRCVTSSWVNTGGVEREERNVEGCSMGYNDTRWVWNGTDCATCPKPQLWQATGNYRCVVDGSNNNTGAQEREERNVESCSWGVNNTRWVSNGQNTGACPLPQTVYARLSIENMYYSGSGTYGDVVVRFYSDAAGTVPLSVSGLTVNYTKDDNCYGPSYPSNTGSGTMLVLEWGAALDYEDSVYNPWWGYESVYCTVYYWLDTNSGYIVIN